MAKSKAIIMRPKPIFIKPPRPLVVTKRKIVHVKPKHKHKRHGGKGFGFLTQHQVNAGLGGLALGFIKKNFAGKLPKIEILGEHGTIAVAAYMLRGKVPLAYDVLTAALVVSAFELGSEGKISGVGEDVDGGYVAGTGF
jgi:hypothetical protein